MDLYPGFYFINAESETMHSHWLTAKELIVSPSKFLKKGCTCNSFALMVVIQMKL